MAEDFIGSGLAFPLRTDSTGGLALVSGDEEIRESITLILGTAPGERPMRPGFGCAIHDLAFAPINATTSGRVAAEVRAALRRWEPRIDVTDVAVTAGRSAGVLSIDVRYVINRTNDPRNLVFPFYAIATEPGTETGA